MTESTLITDGTQNTETGQQQNATETPAQGEGEGSQQQPEGQTTEQGGEAGGDGAKDEGGESKDEAPEYGDFTAPEGVPLDAEALDEFKAIAKANNLTQEEAQKFVNLGGKLLQKQLGKHGEAIETAKAEWAKEASNDKEFGGDKLQENLAVAKKALDTFGTPELRELLTQTGLGNHPEFIRAFYRAGKAISEDGFVGRDAGKPAADPATVMYPSMKKQSA